MNKQLTCRFCQCRLPVNRSVDICIRCCNPARRPPRPPRKGDAHRKFNMDPAFQAAIRAANIQAKEAKEAKGSGVSDLIIDRDCCD